MTNELATDIIIRIVPKYGFLPIIERNGQEIYRGEFRSSVEDTLVDCLDRLCDEADNA